MKTLQVTSSWRRPVIGLWVAMFAVGLMPASVLADDTRYDNTKAPEEVYLTPTKSRTH